MPTEDKFSKIYPQKWIQILLLVGVCVAIYFVNLGRWDLWNPDEPRYAQVAREMIQGGDWILLHFNGKVYGHKPPLFFWLIALSSYLWQGFTSFSVRFPAAFFGTMTVLLTWLFGRRLFSSRSGLLSGLILATSVEFAFLSTRANIDTTLTFFTTASIYCFFRWMQESGAGKPREKGIKGLTIYGFYVGMAIATLAKGPVGFILPLLVALVYFVLLRDWKGIKGMKLFPGMLIFIVIVLAWYFFAILKGGTGYLYETLVTHSLDRYSQGWAKVRPIYYYLSNFPADFLPWFLFLIPAMVYGFSRETLEKRKEFFFLLVWFAVIFVFFSLSKGKRGLYLLPLFPAASLMVGKLWEDFITTPMDHFRREWVSYPLYGLVGVLLIGGAVIPWVVSMKLPAFFIYSLPMAVLMAGGSIALFVLYRFRHLGAVFGLMIAILAGGYFYASAVVFPLINPYKSARSICQEITSRINPGEALGVYGDVGTAPYNYYTDIVPIRELEGKENLLRFLQSTERTFCVLKYKDFLSLKKAEDWPAVQMIVRHNVGDNDLVLISNR
jgi:4-amino-4-deoxy-L-arabinose transferase-like glycosyltransferase